MDLKSTFKVKKPFVRATNRVAAINEMQIPLEDWPSQSPDLNPIENLWSILDRSISDRRCNTKAELWECLQEAWYKLDSSILTKLVESMPRRLNAVIDNKGYPTYHYQVLLDSRRLVGSYNFSLSAIALRVLKNKQI